MAQHVFSGAGAPATTPTAVGQHYINTSNGDTYISGGTSSSTDWKLSNATDVANKLAKSANLSDLANVATARGNLGLGDLSTENVAPISKGGTGQTNATAALNNLLPDQTGNSGKVLKTDGSNPSWQTEAGGGTWGSITGTLSDQTDLQSALDGKQSTISGNNNYLVWKDNSGDVESLETFSISNVTGGLFKGIVNSPDGETGGLSIHGTNTQINPISNSPDRSVNIYSDQIDLDVNSDGFSLGTNGQALRFLAVNTVHGGTSDIGSFEYLNFNFNIGNGTDAIDVKGFGYAFAFGSINANVNLSGPIQGWGFQPNINSAATISTSTYGVAFYDSAVIGCASPGYTSFNASPAIESINNNSNYTAYNIGTDINTFTGNSGFIGLSVAPNLGTFNANGYFQGVNVNPNITSSRYAAGVNVSMDNVTPYAGVQAAVTIQDLTFEFIQPSSFNNSYTMEFVDDGTAGAETVTIAGFAIEVHIEAGVSTATQVKTACDGNPSFVGAVSTTISGTAGDAQVAEGPTNFSGGEDAGRVLAAWLDGDVEITGSLTFGGALSIGKLSAYATQALVNGTGNPASIHGLISAPTVGDNETLTNADIISVNTAALINIGTNSTVSTSFVGVAALGLPAVLNMGSGSTVDKVYAALFALSLDASASGGTVDEMGLCRAVAIPNGATAVNELYGFLFDLPFGDPGTKTFGFYDRPGKNNYFAGNLLIGGTAGSDDLVTNSSVALEIKSTTKAFMPSRMTSTQRDAMTAVNSMVIYNSTTDKLQVYAAGSWVDLH